MFCFIVLWLFSFALGSVELREWNLRGFEGDLDVEYYNARRDFAKAIKEENINEASALVQNPKNELEGPAMIYLISKNLINSIHRVFTRNFNPHGLAIALSAICECFDDDNVFFNATDLLRITPESMSELLQQSLFISRPRILKYILKVSPPSDDQLREFGKGLVMNRQSDRVEEFIETVGEISYAYQYQVLRGVFLKGCEFNEDFIFKFLDHPAIDAVTYGTGLSTAASGLNTAFYKRLLENAEREDLLSCNIQSFFKQEHRDLFDQRAMVLYGVMGDVSEATWKSRHEKKEQIIREILAEFFEAEDVLELIGGYITFY